MHIESSYENYFCENNESKIIFRFSRADEQSIWNGNVIWTCKIQINNLSKIASSPFCVTSFFFFF